MFFDCFWEVVGVFCFLLVFDVCLLFLLRRFNIYLIVFFLLLFLFVAVVLFCLRLFWGWLVSSVELLGCFLLFAALLDAVIFFQNYLFHLVVLCLLSVVGAIVFVLVFALVGRCFCSLF